MVKKRTSIHGQWSSQWVFVLAATGSAVGLGNIWRFPYMAGESGGGAFIMLYIICVILMGTPIMAAEIMIGRRGRQSPLNTMRTLAAEGGHSRHWQILGILGMLAGFLIMSYYSVIAGWVLSYIFKTASGTFEAAAPDTVVKIFNDFTSNPWILLFWHSVFMVMCMTVTARGVKGGLEKAVRILMPTLFCLLLIMVGYAMSTDKFLDGMAYLLIPDFTTLAANFPEVFLNASGHAFFSLSIGMGAIMVYGSYLPTKTSIANATIAIATMDSVVAILASLAIFPLVFTYNLEPSSGPSLIFITLPIAFGQMPGGGLFGSMFFFLVMFAAWTSGISLLEPVVTWLVENKGMRRLKATIITGGIAWIVGIGTVLSFNHWAFSFTFAGLEKHGGIFDIIDILTANILLPLGGLIISIFVAWIMSKMSVKEELDMNEGLYKFWFFTTKYVASVGVGIIFLSQFGIF